ncbi:hypothetical protein BC835DRAFT_1517908 [Cytidiella melzeri]|nr:hypothetical protein BC835DRAFT_1517908 [Cytidiella melzeri]
MGSAGRASEESHRFPTYRHVPASRLLGRPSLQFYTLFSLLVLGMAEPVNPHLQIRPNFRDPILQPLVALGVTAEKTAEQVIEDLEQEHEHPPIPPQQVAPQRDMPAEVEGEMGSVGSRTRGSLPALESDEDSGVPLLKMGKLVVGKKLDDELLFEPSQKVINDLRKLQYVYLHHFLDTKRKEAFEH